MPPLCPAGHCQVPAAGSRPSTSKEHSQNKKLLQLSGLWSESLSWGPSVLQQRWAYIPPCLGWGEGGSGEGTEWEWGIYVQEVFSGGIAGQCRAAPALINPGSLRVCLETRRSSRVRGPPHWVHSQRSRARRKVGTGLLRRWGGGRRPGRQVLQENGEGWGGGPAHHPLSALIHPTVTLQRGPSSPWLCC